MSITTATAGSIAQRDHRRWPAIILTMLAGNVLIVGATVYFATTTTGNLVESDWYDRALSWDKTKADKARLGWTPAFTVAPGEADGTFRITLAISDAVGADLTDAVVRLRAVHNAHPDKAVKVPMTQIETDGRTHYVAVIPASTLGLWSLRAHIEHAGDTLDLEQEVTLGPTSP